MTYSRGTSGFTVLELLMVLLLTGVLYTFMIGDVQRNDDAIKYEQTRARMEAIRIAIIGSETSTDFEGKRSNFGYYGDVGAMPSTLYDLITKPAAMATWAFNTLHGIGVGWRGPYIVSTMISGEKAYDRDGWNRLFTYSAAGTPSLSSLGSDNSVGGAGYASDITMQFPASARFSTVSGILENYNARVSGGIVQMIYPSAGALVTYGVVTGNNGVYTFNSIPIGVQAIRTTSPATTPSRQIVIDRPAVVVPASLLNFFGTQEVVTYVAASHFRNGANIFASIASSYSSNVELKQIQVDWTGGGNLTYVGVNGSGQTVATTTGVPVAVTADMIVTPNAAQTAIELRFSASPTTGTTMTLTFTWYNRSRTDSVNFVLL